MQPNELDEAIFIHVGNNVAELTGLRCVTRCLWVNEDSR